MTTPKEYAGLDKDVYEVDSSKNKNPYRVTGNNSFWIGGQQYLVLKTVDANDPKNSNGYADNGFQGMAVAPMTKTADGVKIDFSQTIIAYAGTNASDLSGNDLDTDLRNVVLGTKTFSAGQDSQFTSAEQFYKEVSKMPDVKVVSTTGHSLGGALAQKVAATNHLSAVTFSTAGVGKQLTAEEKEWINGEGKAFILNYMHKGDQIPGDTNAKGFGTALYAGEFSSGALLSGHMLTSYSFDNDGNVKDQAGVGILSPQMLKAVKSSYKKIVAPKIKELKAVLSSGGVSGSAKIALETELVAYTAKALRAKAVDWYETCVRELEKIQKDYKNTEEQLIVSCQNAGGPMMSNYEAKSIYHRIAGHQAYQEHEFKEVQNQLKQAYKKQLTIADQMESLVSKTLENDQSLAQFFR